jgi:hypothetical protein
MKYIKLFEEVNKQEVNINYWNNGQKKYEFWFLNGKKHREDGPASQFWFDNGQKKFEFWFLNGKYHREDGPANKFWFENGKKKSEYWFLNNKQYSRKKWIEKLKEIGSPHYKEQKMLIDAEKYNL